MKDLDSSTQAGTKPRPESLYSSLFQSFPDAALLLDSRSLRVIEANKAASSLLGYLPEELAGVPFQELLSPAHRERIGAILASEQREVFSGLDLTVCSRGGKPLLCEARIATVETDNYRYFVVSFKDITERRRDETTLVESERRYRSLVEHSPDIIIEIDLQGTILYSNRVLTGVRNTDAIGTSLLDYIPAQHHKKVRRALHRAFVRKKNSAVEISIATPDGIRWWSTRILPLKERGQIDRFFLIVTDVTYGKRIEEALRLSEERYRLLVDSSPVPMIVRRQDKLVYLNPAAVKMLGANSEDELLGRSLFDFVHPEDHWIMRTVVEQHGTSNSSTTKRVRAVTLKGEVRHLEFVGITVNFEGELARLAVVNDITERLKAEEALRESEKKFRYIVENMRDAVWIMDLNWQHVFISPSIQAIRGFTPEEIMTLPIEQSLPPESLENARRLLEWGLERGGIGEDGQPIVVRFEQQEYKKDGSTVWTEVTASLIFDENGKPAGMMGITRDITERRKAEDILRQSEAQYRSLVDNSPVPIVIYRDEKAVYVNSRTLELLGAESPDEVVGRCMYDFIHEDHRAAIRKAVAMLGDNPGPASYEAVKFVSLRGEILVFDIKAISVTFGGEPARMLIFQEQPKSLQETTRAAEQTTAPAGTA